MEVIRSGAGWRRSWHFALGAGCCGVLLAVVSGLLLDKPFWLRLLTDDVGWTMYPPLTALPQAWPGGEESLRECLEAGISGGLFGAGWLRAWWQRRRAASAEASRWFGWSVLLVVPLLVQLGGNVYAARYQHNAEEQLLLHLRHTPPDSAPGTGH
ncbi:hypothetical protein [Hymenobacter metallilatus]|uniref:Uncharacterized protein n=1 Tax=Hymenobacter metallilatus TaxID=2493666 RepID=A0A3R9M6G2_9BACT|nr:hypothetical protein [Hymenobacter metallilatus]RSK33172.1 hypothetical protein EI290_10680 [Hymenobacter metallilatus]